METSRRLKGTLLLFTNKLADLSYTGNPITGYNDSVYLDEKLHLAFAEIDCKLFAYWVILYVFLAVY